MAGGAFFFAVFFATLTFFGALIGPVEIIGGATGGGAEVFSVTGAEVFFITGAGVFAAAVVFTTRAETLTAGAEVIGAEVIGAGAGGDAKETGKKAGSGAARVTTGAGEEKKVGAGCV